MRRFLIFLTLTIPLFGQSTPVHVMDSSVSYAFGSPSGLANCSGSISGQSGQAAQIGTSVVLPITQPFAVTLGVVDFWALPSLNGFSYSLQSTNPPGGSFTCSNGIQRWAVSPISVVIPAPAANALVVTSATTPVVSGNTWTTIFTVTGSLTPWTANLNAYVTAANPQFTGGYLVTGVGSGTLTVVAATTPPSAGTPTALIKIPTTAWTGTGALVNAGPISFQQVIPATTPTPNAQYLLSQIAPSGCTAGEQAYFNGLSWGCRASSVNPMTTQYSMIIGGPSGAEVELFSGLPGTIGYQLQMTSTGEAWLPPAMAGPSVTTAGYVPTWANNTGNGLTVGFPLVLSSQSSSIPETSVDGTLDPSFLPFTYGIFATPAEVAQANLSGHLDQSWMPGFSGAVQSSAGATVLSLTNPSGNTSLVMTGSGSFVSGHSPVFDSHGNIIDSGGTAGIGSVTVTGTPTSGYVPTWTSITSIGPGFAVSSIPALNTIPQTDGTSTIPSGFAWALSGVIQSSAGSAVTSLANPTGTGAKIVTGTGTYTTGHGTIIDSNGNVVDSGSPPGSGSGNVLGPGTVTNNYAALWTGVSNTLGAGILVTSTPGANVIPETGGGGTLANGFIQTASLSQIGLGNVFGSSNQISASYAGGTATVSLANPLILPGPATFAAATTGGASFVIPNGTAPTSPTVGMVWAVAGVPSYYNGSASQAFVLSGRNVNTNVPLTGGGSLVGDLTLGIETATAVQIGAGNVGQTANQVCAAYSGGTATLSICNPFVFPGPATLAASTTGGSGFNIPTGPAPTSPNNGDLWDQSGVLHLYYTTNQSILTSATAPGGDVSGTFAALSVNDVHGVAYPASPSAGGVPVITGSNVASYIVLPSCPDTGGNHLNWTGSAWVCGTTGGTAGSVAFSGVLTGTSTTALLMGSSGSLGFSGTGTINANILNGVPWPVLPGSINTVPVVTSISGAGTVTYEALPNAALANSSVTLNATAHQTTVSGSPVSLGGTITVGTVQGIDTTSSPQFSALGIGAAAGSANTITIGSTVLATAGAGTSTFPAVTGTVVNTGTSGLVTNAMLANSSMVVNASSPLTVNGTGSATAALGGSGCSAGVAICFAIATANASQIGAGNVNGSSSIGVAYSGGTATLTSATQTNPSWLTLTSLPSLAAVGIITSGTWHGGVIGSQWGGLGVNNAPYTLTLTGSIPIGTDCVDYTTPNCIGGSVSPGPLAAAFGTLGASGNLTVGGSGTITGNISSGGAISAYANGPGVSYARYGGASSVPPVSWSGSPGTCTMTVTNGGGTGATFMVATTTGAPTVGTVLTAGTYPNGQNFTSNPTTATPAGGAGNTCTGSGTITLNAALLNPANLFMQTGTSGTLTGIAAPPAGISAVFDLPTAAPTVTQVPSYAGTTYTDNAGTLHYGQAWLTATSANTIGTLVQRDPTSDGIAVGFVHSALQATTDTFIIQAAAGNTTGPLAVQNSTPQNMFFIDRDFGTNITYLRGIGSPTVSCAFSGAGTSPTCPSTTSGSDVAGTITMTVGSGSPAASATVFTVAFANPPLSAPAFCGLYAVNSTARALPNNQAPFIGPGNWNTTGFTVSSAATGLAPGVQYEWGYVCGG